MKNFFSSLFTPVNSRDSMQDEPFGATSKGDTSYSRDRAHEGSSRRRRSRSRQRSATPKRADSPATPSPLEIAVPLIPEVPRSHEEVQGWRESPEPKRKSTDERSAKRSRRDSGRVHTHELWALPQHTADTRADTHPPTPSRKESRLRIGGRENSKAALKQEREALTARVQELSDQARESEEREKYWETRCTTLEKDLKRALTQHERTKEDFQSMLESNRVASGHVHDLQSANSRLEARVRELEDQLQRTQAKYGETSALLNVRSAELKGAQVFLSKADLYAGGEIIQMINALNEEIFQCCANIAEGVVSEQERFTEDESTLAHCRSHVTECIGQRMVALLEASREVANGDTLPLQTALQILLVGCCQGLLMAFDYEDQAVDKKLALIYESACANEEQAVAGRWRSITMAHLRPQQSSARIPFLSKRIIQTLALAGFSRRSPSYKPLTASLKGGDRLGPIEKSVWMVRQAIGEGVTSCDILPMSWPSAQPFEGGSMEDMYPEEEPSQARRNRGSRGIDNGTPSPSEEKAKGLPILGTVQLGVQKTTSVRSGRDGRMIRQKEILVRPKVILARTLEEEVK
ncbi:hypothetical protein BKA70DRAFT_1272228 [Coprinopsis sp. MPI-PUGE-AT-0042]|nr:hypothetical protein BKA70DRAFT_1272228 [Coprinopsis sp. MPI-PUGE-AT-0042]